MCVTKLWLKKYCKDSLLLLFPVLKHRAPVLHLSSEPGRQCTRVGASKADPGVSVAQVIGSADVLTEFSQVSKSGTKTKKHFTHADTEGTRKKLKHEWTKRKSRARHTQPHTGTELILTPAGCSALPGSPFWGRQGWCCYHSNDAPEPLAEPCDLQPCQHGVLGKTWPKQKDAV